MENKEIECRFLEVNKNELIKKLYALGAKDEGEEMLEETIIYDAELKWREQHRFIRLRKIGDTIKLTYKNNPTLTVDGATEIEFGIDDMKKAELVFEKIGLLPYRHQQKLRHTFKLKDVTIDIDTWPRTPPYVEIEGDSEKAIEEVSKSLGFNWKDANFKNAAWVLENKYNIPVRQMRWFTFDRFE